MHGSGSGPLGALLVIVPLAAIPVFAIVGVPHFAPLVASPSDEEDLIADADDTDASRSLASTETPRKERTADDLFAPISDSPSRLVASAVKPPDAKPQVDRISVADARRPSMTLPPPEALDQWEIRSDVAGAKVRSNGKNSSSADGSSSTADGDASDSLQIPADEDKVSTTGFSRDLLTPEPNGRSNPGTRGAPDRPLDAPLDERANIDHRREKSPSRELSDRAEMRPQTSPDQTGWQAAARRLKELGISKYRLESQIESQTFAFICTIASPDNPRIARRFEADADDPLQAVQKVLEEVEEWRSRNDRANVED